MIFRYIGNIFNGYNFNLEILNKDTNLYTTLFLQHKGVFHPAADKFGNQQDCSDKFSKFLALAKLQNVSLAVTPEYSCPWASIAAVINNVDLWPSNHKLWALGCESITPADIVTLRDQDLPENVVFYFDQEVLNNGGGVLLDPLCYIFKASDNNGNSKLIVLVQFKTQHMGVWHDDIEQEKYIPGKEVYVLRNDVNSVALFTIICSEVANFSITTEFKTQLDNRWDENPFIILNIQMNPKPSHEIFKDFRSAIMRYQNKDILTLNWAKGSLFSNQNPILNYSKSSIFFKSTTMNYELESRFIENHSRGLYYTYREHSLHAYFLNSKEDAFLIANHKPAAGGANAAMFRRTGPECRNIFLWDSQANSFEEKASVSDDFVTMLDLLHCNNTILRNPAINVIDKERLINISSGNILTKNHEIRWHTIDQLFTFSLSETETIRRLTFSHDEVGDPDRRQLIDIIDNLQTIVNTPAYFPRNLAAFVNNCTVVMFFNDNGYNYRYNLVSTDNKHRATVAYVGRVDLATASRTLKKLLGLFARSDQSRKLVVVWYKEGAATIKAECLNEQVTITDDVTYDPSNSILK